MDAKGATSSCATLGPDCRLVDRGTDHRARPRRRAASGPGDVIDKVDGTPLDGLTVDAVRATGSADRRTPPSGSRSSAAGGAPFDVEIIRAVIVQPEVETKDLANGTVGYIRLSGFSDHAATQFDRVTALDVAAGARS